MFADHLLPNEMYRSFMRLPLEMSSERRMIGRRNSIKNNTYGLYAIEFYDWVSFAFNNVLLNKHYPKATLSDFQEVHFYLHKKTVAKNVTKDRLILMMNVLIHMS